MFTMRFFQLALFLSLIVPAILPGQTRPNILFIAIDDLKPVLACYGDLLAHTPNIDRLAARGVVFDSAYVNQAVCGPSRNSLMLGLRPQSTGLYDLGTHFRDIYPDAVTFSQRLMAVGYQA
jgi:iduronate 2-sulfatase